MKRNMFTTIRFSGRKQSLLSLAMVVLTGLNTVLAQVSIAAHNTDFNTDFNGWNNTLPTGWARTGANYVGTTNATNGGVYAIPNAGFGYRPSSTSPANSCTITGTFQNNTGSDITSLEISYDAFQIAANPRTPNWTVTSTLGNVSALTWNNNPSASTANPDHQSMTIAVNVPAGSTFTITFASDRGLGSGSSPMIGLNNVNLKSVSAAATCNFPANLAENNVTDQTADFNWDAAGGNTYEYVLSTSATNPAGAGTPTAGTAYTAAGLTSSTNYYFFVRTDCGSGTFSDWTMVNFTTAVTPCPAVTGTTVSNVTANTADLSWNTQGMNGSEYVLDQSAADPATAGTFTTGTTFTATALAAGTPYYFHVRTDCGAGNFSPWTTINFTTVCPAPLTATISNITAESAEFFWSGDVNNFEYSLDVTSADPIAGTPIFGTHFMASGMAPSTMYYFHVRTDCGNGLFSDWATTSFTTICPDPTGLIYFDVTNESAELAWHGDAMDNFEYVLSQSGTIPASGASITGTSYTAEGLEPSTEYFFFLRTDCGNGVFSDWAAVHFLTACPTVNGVNITGLLNESADLQWNAAGVSEFEYVLDQTSADPSGGTSISGGEYHATGLSQGTTYYFHIRSDCGNGFFSEWTTYSFTTLCTSVTGLTVANIVDTEADFSWNGTSSAYRYVINQNPGNPLNMGTVTTATTVHATGLTPLTVYYMHVRSDCGNGNYSPWATIAFSTHDSVCHVPTGLLVENITSSSADFSWDDQTGITQYQFVANTTSSDPSTGFMISSNEAGSYGLTPSTTYYLHVRSYCGAGNFSEWTTISFATAAPPQCTAPTGLTATNVTDISADIFWAQSNATGYEYTLDQTLAHPSVAGTASTASSFSTFTLQPSTTYYVHVRKNCGNGNFSEWVTLPFTTDSDLGLAENQQLTFTAYPNPATDFVTIQSLKSEGTVTLINLHGQQLQSIALSETAKMDLSGIQKGVYILLYELNEVSSTVRLVVE